MAMLPSSDKGDVSSSMLLGYPEKFTIKYFVNGTEARTPNLFGFSYRWFPSTYTNEIVFHGNANSNKRTSRERRIIKCQNFLHITHKLIMT